MLKWFYKQKNSRRIWITVAAWMFFLHVTDIFWWIFESTNGLTVPIEDRLLPKFFLSWVAIIITIHAVMAYKAEKDAAIPPRPPHEIRAEIRQLNEQLRRLNAEIKAQVFITNIDPNAYDGKKVRALKKEFRYVTRRLAELDKEIEKAINMGAPTPEATKTHPTSESVQDTDKL